MHVADWVGDWEMLASLSSHLLAARSLSVAQVWLVPVRTLLGAVRLRLRGSLQSLRATQVADASQISAQRHGRTRAAESGVKRMPPRPI